MELRHLRYFTAVVGAGSFARGAASLRVAQPSLSRQLRDLERELGASLLVRESSGARLTPEGEGVHRSAEIIMDSVAELWSTARLSQLGLIGRCRLAVGPVPLLGDRVGVALAAMLKRLPDLDLEVREISSVEHARMLRAGETDIGVGSPPAPSEPGIDVSVFYQDPIDSAAIPSSHALAKRSHVTTSDLRDLHVLVLSRMALPHVTVPIVDALRQHGFTTVEEIDTFTSVTANVVAGRGWTPVTRSQRGGRPTDGYKVVPIDDLLIPFEIAMTLRAGEKSPTVCTVARALREVRDNGWQRATVPRVAGGPHDGNGDGTEPPAPLALEFRHLRAFITLMEERNLTSAAKRLELSQPGLSRRLADLERILEVELFERGARGVLPTHVADLLERHARRALAVADAMSGDVHDFRRGVEGTLRMGIVSPVLGTILSPIMASLASTCPRWEIIHHTLDTPEQPRALERGGIDVGIAHALPGLLDDAAIDGIRLWDDRIDTVMLSNDHRLAKRASIHATDLDGEPAIFPHPQFNRAFHEQLMEAFEALGLRPMIVGSYFSLRTMWSLAANGVGWMVGAHSQRRAAPPGLVAVPVEGLAIPWGFDLLWRRDEQRQEILAAIRAIRGAALPSWKELQPRSGEKSVLGSAA